MTETPAPLAETSAAVTALAPTKRTEVASAVPAAVLLWRTGSALAAPPAIGPDGAIYIASSQGVLDVLEPAGGHRFSITLGGAPTGAMHVDARGRAYLGLATGKVVAVTAQGQTSFSFKAPSGISGDVSFAEGQGLLFLGHDGVVIGLNRGGAPTMRFDVHEPITAGPVGIFGWCVVATARGELVWGDRWGKRQRLKVDAPVRVLRPTADGGLWALSERGLEAFSSKRTPTFRRADVIAMATSSRALLARGIEGAVLTSGSQLEWIDAGGRRLSLAALRPASDPPGSVVMGLDDDANLWLARGEGELHIVRSNGATSEPHVVREALLEPVFDASRRHTIVATVSGAIYRVAWMPSVAHDEAP